MGTSCEICAFSALSFELHTNATPHVTSQIAYGSCTLWLRVVIWQVSDLELTNEVPTPTVRLRYEDNGNSLPYRAVVRITVMIYVKCFDCWKWYPNADVQLRPLCMHRSI